MRITSSAIELTSSQRVERATRREESLQLWVGDPPPGPRASAGAPRGAPVAPPAAGGTPSDGVEQPGPPSLDDPEQLSVRDALDLAILRKFFGLERDQLRSARDVRKAYDETAAPAVDHPAGGEAPPRPAGWGLRYDRKETTIEYEGTSFTARGRVTTADGRAIELEAALTMERSRVTSTEVHVRAGDAVKVDPLVVNLSGGPAAFSGKTAFDLDADGKPEAVAQLAGGSAYLALDRNGNGKVDSGAELFGPSTGSGFGELAALDQDGNGWVDEGDAAFGALRLWSPGSGALQTLQAAAVGALYTRAASTAFDLRDPTGATPASVAQTGVFLREDGSAGTVQHVDLIV